MPKRSNEALVEEGLKLIVTGLIREDREGDSREAEVMAAAAVSTLSGLRLDILRRIERGREAADSPTPEL